MAIKINISYSIKVKVAVSPTRGSSRTIKVKQAGYTRTYRNGRLVSETNPEGKRVIRIATKKRSAKEGGGVDVTAVEKLPTRERLKVEKYQAKLRKKRKLEREKALRQARAEKDLKNSPGRFQTQDITEEAIKSIEARRLSALAAREARREQAQARQEFYSPGAVAEPGQESFSMVRRRWREDGILGSTLLGTGVDYLTSFFEGVGRAGEYVITLPQRVKKGSYQRDVETVKEKVSDPIKTLAPYGRALRTDPDVATLELGGLALFSAIPGGFRGARTAEDIADTATVTRTTGRAGYQQFGDEASVILETEVREVASRSAPKGGRVRTLAFEGEGIAVKPGSPVAAEVTATGRFKVGRGSALVDDLKISPKAFSVADDIPVITEIKPGKATAKETFNVEGYKRTQIRDVDLLEITDTGVTRRPYVSAKDISVKASTRTINKPVDVKVLPTAKAGGLNADAVILGRLQRPKAAPRVQATKKPPTERLVILTDDVAIDVKRTYGNTPFRVQDKPLISVLTDLSGADLTVRGVRPVNLAGSGVKAAQKAPKTLSTPLRTGRGAVISVEMPAKPLIKFPVATPRELGKTPILGVSERPGLVVGEKPAIKVSSVPRTSVKLGQELALKKQSKPKVSIGESPKSVLKKRLVSVTPPVTVTTPKVLLDVSGTPTQRTRLQPPRVVTKTRPKTTTKKKPRLTPLLLPKLSFGGSIGDFNPTFDVQVRKRGIFRTIASGLTKGEALRLGSFRTEQTAAATFRLKETGVTEKKDKGFSVSRDFERRPGLTFVQKREKRISTLGELKEITFKGLSVLRAKKGFRL